MSANDSLPVILVSAVDAAAASVLISEIIEDGGPGSRCDGAECGAVWRLRNKYYSAAARLLPLPDGAAPPPGLDVQAHVIYLTEDECSESAAAAACARRAEAAAGAGVRLVAARAAREGAALARWASARRYEPVALLAPAGVGEGEEETRGAARLREALHAHAWPGMRRAGAPDALAARAARPPGDDDDSDDGSASSDGSWGEWVGGGGGGTDDEAGAVRRAGQFAEALALLPARPPGQDDAQRRLHAEQLVVAFCRALGHDLRQDTGEAGGEGGAQ